MQIPLMETTKILLRATSKNCIKILNFQCVLYHQTQTSSSEKVTALERSCIREAIISHGEALVAIFTSLSALTRASLCFLEAMSRSQILACA